MVGVDVAYGVSVSVMLTKAGVSVAVSVAKGVEVSVSVCAQRGKTISIKQNIVMNPINFMNPDINALPNRLTL
jgi:hypothetical protein